ncbi:MAG: hypothetical protein MI976_18070 [Pseudomonadales bacterium]|nr:hypothetical protein [Pseudomonadales bacterium]
MQLRHKPAKTITLMQVASVLLAVLLLNGCKSQSFTIVDDLPESENLFFTPEGRLFVSGGENVFEIIQNTDGSYQKLDMFHAPCLVEGIIQRYNHIYGVCSKTNLAEFGQSHLIAAEISPSTPNNDDIIESGKHPFMEMEFMRPLPEMALPNGMEIDEFGNIFVADSGKGHIFRIQFMSPTDVSHVEIWSEKTSPFVNGLEWVGDELYFTGVKLAGVKSVFGKVNRQADGSAGAPIILFERTATVLDDIAAYKDGFLITDYLKGSIIYWKDGAVITETEKDTFYSPTAVQQGRAPMFSEEALIVTEKGIIFNDNPAYGNKVGLIYPTF